MSRGLGVTSILAVPHDLDVLSLCSQWGEVEADGKEGTVVKVSASGQTKRSSGCLGKSHVVESPIRILNLYTC